MKEAVLVLKAYFGRIFRFELEGSDLLLSLWVLHTYFFDLFSSSQPLLVACKRSSLVGASEALEILSHMGKRFLLKSAFLGLEIFKSGPATLVVENLEGLAQRSSNKPLELISFILSSSRRGLLLNDFDRDEARTKQVEAFLPKAFELQLEALNSADLRYLVEECLVLKVGGLSTDVCCSDLREVHLTVKEVLSENRHDMRIALAREVPRLFGEISTEKRSLLEPLFSIAQLCGGDVLQDVREAIMRSGSVCEADKRKILEESLAFFEESGLEEVGSVELARRLYEKGLISPSDSSNPVSLGKALSRSFSDFGIRPVTLKRFGKAFKGYRRRDIQKALEVKAGGPLGRVRRS